MVDLKALDPKTLRAMDPAVMAEVATRMLAELTAQSRQIQQHQDAAQRYEREIKFKDAKLEKITFELARLKAWKFGARTERMNAEQRQMFEDTAAEDEADLQAQLDALQGQASTRHPREDPAPAAPAEAAREPAPRRAPA
jgi:transposase